MNEPWYKINDTDSLHTPSLIFYPHRIRLNLEKMVQMVGDSNRLRPHIKTHKCPEIVRKHFQFGIYKFKCSTIAECEMLASLNVPDVLLAYQPTGPNFDRLAALMNKFPETTFSCLCDDEEIAIGLNHMGQRQGKIIPIYVDLDVGMHRTGIEPGDRALKLCQKIVASDHLQLKGLHAYDGHIRDARLKDRTIRCNAAFQKVTDFQGLLKEQNIIDLTIIAGGSPSFPIHARREEVEVSPGTITLWDKGYDELLEGLDFLFGAVLATRIVSKPSTNRICLDIGHKAISAEHQKPPLIMGLEDFKLVGHSEEHMVLEVPDNELFRVGQILYAIPHHICPTVALHDAAQIVRDHTVVDEWKIIGRTRKISI